MTSNSDRPAANMIPVRMGEMAVSRDKRDVFSVIGIGSCIAAILIAPQKGAVALAHIVLPEASMTGGRDAPPGKFADTAIPAMLYELRSLGVRPEDTYAIMLGGATMFGGSHGSKLSSVGERNIEAVRRQLVRHGIGTASQDVGGDSGRSVEVAIADQQVHVRSGQNEPFLLTGSQRPLVIKGSELGADSEQEPFPGGIWEDDAIQASS